MSFAVVSSGEGFGEVVPCRDACIDHHLTEPGIHLFTASWCGHCKRMLAEHDDRVSAAEEEGDPVVQKNIDSNKNIANIKVVRHDRSVFSENELDEMIANRDIEGYPTIYFVKNGVDGKRGKMQYRGSRKLDDLNEAYEDFLNNTV